MHMIARFHKSTKLPSEVQQSVLSHATPHEVDNRLLVKTFDDVAAAQT